MSGESIGRRVAKGAAWSVLLRLSIRGLGLISTLILARLLVPEDFGLVAMATLVIGVIELIFDFSFSQFLIRAQGEDRRLYDTVWTLAILRSLMVAALIAAASTLAAQFYGEPRLTPIFLALAASSLIAGFENVGVVDFQKKLEFHREFKFRAATKVVAFAVTISIAVTTKSYWALVIGTLASNVASVVLSYALCTFRPRLCLSKAREVFGFSAWIMVASVFGAFLTRGPALVLGRETGPASVGLFEVGREVADLPTTELVWPITRTLYPGYASAAGDPASVGKLFLNSTALTVMLGAPLSLGIAATAALVVHIALGEKWLAAVPVIEVLALAGLLRLSYAGAQSIVLALGRPSQYALLSMFSFVVTLPCVLYGAVAHGLIGTAIGFFGGILISTTAWQLLALRLVGRSMVELWKGPARSVLSGLVMYAAVAWVVAAVPIVWSGLLADLLTLGCAILVGAVVYVVASWGIWVAAGRPIGAERILLDELRMRGVKLFEPDRN